MLPRSLLLLFILTSILTSLLLKKWLDTIDIISIPAHVTKKLLTAGNGDSEIQIFSIDIDNERIEDAKSRIKQGMEKLPENTNNFLRNLTNVMNDYDWKQHERFLNTFKQYKGQVDGVDIHFLRVSISPPQGAQVVPIVLLHGFPGAYWDFYKIIPILSNPRRYNFDFGVQKPLLFDVIVPSLPGFIFSEMPEDQDFSPLHSARLLIGLMRNIGVTKYFVHGNEQLGTEIATIMAAVDKNARGIHLSNPFVPLFFNTKVSLKYLMMEGISLWDLFWLPLQYSEKTHFAATTMQDSPLSQCSVIMHFWKIGSIRKKELNELFTFDELATICYLYWVTDSLPPALTVMHNRERIKERFQVTIPSAILQTADAPWKIAHNILSHQFLNLTRVTALEKGGLFHSLEMSEQLAADIFRFVELVLL